VAHKTANINCINSGAVDIIRNAYPRTLIDEINFCRFMCDVHERRAFHFVIKRQCFIFIWNLRQIRERRWLPYILSKIGTVQFTKLWDPSGTMEPWKPAKKP